MSVQKERVKFGNQSIRWCEVLPVLTWPFDPRWRWMDHDLVALKPGESYTSTNWIGTGWPPLPDWRKVLCLWQESNTVSRLPIQ
jgi:hypothetical protein